MCDVLKKVTYVTHVCMHTRVYTHVYHVLVDSCLICVEDHA